MSQASSPSRSPSVERLPRYKALKKLAHTSLLRGNDVESWWTGGHFDSILPGLARARRYALVQFYIVRDDDLGGASRPR